MVPPGALTARTRPVGRAVADAVTAAPADWLLGRRHVVLLVHGFNNSFDEGQTSYRGPFTATLDGVGYFYWPGDSRGGKAASALSYPYETDSARASARLLAEYLRGAFGPGGTPSVVSFVAHSLGCRLVLEALREAVAAGLPWPEVRVLALLAAAVPVDLVGGGQPLEAAARTARTLAVFYSFADQVLHFAFPTGQSAAYALGIESAAYARAVGRYGEPAGLTPQRFEVVLGHSMYWPSGDVAARVAGLFGAAVPNVVAVRELPTRPLPPERELRLA